MCIQRHAHTHTHTHTSRDICTHRKLASRKWGFFQQNQSACTSPNIWHNSLLLTHTSQRAAFNHSLTYSHKHSWALPALPLGLSSWLKHSLPRRKWMRASGWPGGQWDRPTNDMSQIWCQRRPICASVAALSGWCWQWTLHNRMILQSMSF